MKARIGLYLIAVLSILIGVYPLLYLVMPEDQGLLSTKPSALLDNALWTSAFKVHIGFGGIALLSGWPQFFKNWRNRYLNWHRRIGLVYLFAVVFSGSAALYLAFNATGGMLTGLGFGIMSVLWLVFTILAFLHVKGGSIVKHQKFMILSFSLCFGAVTLRILLPLLSQLTGDFITAYRVVAWMCWVPNLLVAYLFLIPKSIIK